MSLSISVMACESGRFWEKQPLAPFPLNDVLWSAAARLFGSYGVAIAALNPDIRASV